MLRISTKIGEFIEIMTQVFKNAYFLQDIMILFKKKIIDKTVFVYSKPVFVIMYYSFIFKRQLFITPYTLSYSMKLPICSDLNHSSSS